MNKQKKATPAPTRIADSISGQKERITLGNSEIIVVRPNQGERLNIDRELLGDHYDRQTDFGLAVIDLGDHLESMKGLVIPEEERWGTKNLPSKVSLVPNDSAMDEITIIANDPNAYSDSELQEEYGNNLETVMKGIKESGKLNSNAVRVAIKRAGVVAAKMLHEEDNALAFEAKRLPIKTGGLAVGIEDEDGVLTPENLDGKDIEIDEVFLASGSTLIAFMLELDSREIKPKSITVVAPFTTQQGAQAMLDVSISLGWETKIVASRIYYVLNDDLYVMVTPEEEVWEKVTKGDLEKPVQAGGDAGDLTERRRKKKRVR